MFELMKDSVWQKASGLVKAKYGKSLSYRAIKLISEEASAEKKEFYQSGDDLIIPLRINNHFLGDVVVDRGSLLEAKEKSEIAELVKFLVEPTLYNIKLEKTEKSLRNEIELVRHEMGAEVVSLHGEEIERPQLLSQVFLLKSHTELTRNRVALKLHEMSERQLFVRLDDIMKSVKSKQDLATLSDVTIYIDDIEKLNSETLQMLQDVLNGLTGAGPLFLIGSSLNQEQIMQKTWPEQLKKDLAGFFFDIDRVPLAQQTSEDVLDLLFFQFEGSMT